MGFASLTLRKSLWSFRGGFINVYAVIDNGGHQYRVTEGEVVHLQKIEGETGQAVDFQNIIAVGSGETIEIVPGKLEKVQVKGVIVEQGRDKKIVVFKKKRRKNYRRKNGHRQHFTAVRITEIVSA